MYSNLVAGHNMALALAGRRSHAAACSRKALLGVTAFFMLVGLTLLGLDFTDSTVAHTQHSR